MSAIAGLRGMGCGGLLLRVDDCRSVCPLAGDAGFATGSNFEVLHKSVENKSNFKFAWNCNGIESLDPSKDNQYEVDPCCTAAYRSFQSTVRL